MWPYSRLFWSLWPLHWRTFYVGFKQLVPYKRYINHQTNLTCCRFEIPPNGQPIRYLLNSPMTVQAARNAFSQTVDKMFTFQFFLFSYQKHLPQCFSKKKTKRSGTDLLSTWETLNYEVFCSCVVFVLIFLLTKSLRECRLNCVRHL